MAAKNKEKESRPIIPVVAATSKILESAPEPEWPPSGLSAEKVPDLI